MQVEYIVDDTACCLEVRINGTAQFLVTPALLWPDERHGVISYLRSVASRLSELHSAGRVDQAAALLMQADRRLHHGRRTDYEIAD